MKKKTSMTLIDHSYVQINMQYTIAHFLIIILIACSLDFSHQFAIVINNVDNSDIQ